MLSKVHRSSKDAELSVNVTLKSGYEADMLACSRWEKARLLVGFSILGVEIPAYWKTELVPHEGSPPPPKGKPESRASPPQYAEKAAKASKMPWGCPLAPQSCGPK